MLVYSAIPYTDASDSAGSDKAGSDYPRCDSAAGPTRVALKCSGSPYSESNLNVRKHVDVATIFGEAEWNLQTIDYFVDGEFECGVFQLGGQALGWVLEESNLDATLVGEIALRMIGIVSDMHDAKGWAEKSFNT